MTAPRRWSFAVPLKELAGATSSLTRADIAKGAKDPAYEARLAQARVAIAEARRAVRWLARRTTR